MGALIVLALTGCAPQIGTDPPRFGFATGWQSPVPGAPRLMDNSRWWQSFEDPTLDRLIVLALADSPSLAAAMARVDAAQAGTRLSGPFAINAGAGGTVSGANGASAERQTRLDLGLDVLFDPGRSRGAQRAGAGAELARAQASAAGARLFLIAQITDTYLGLRHAERSLSLATAEAARGRKTLALTQTLAEAGEGTRLDMLRSQARMASIETGLPALHAAIGRKYAELAVLAGYGPGALPADVNAALHSPQPQPRAKLAPDPGLPADLVRNRPDLRVAEANYDAARAGLGAARAALYPRLSLSGTIEARQNIDNGAIIGSGTEFSLGPSLRLPVLPQTAARAGVDGATALVTAAYGDWRSGVLQALLEVEIALLDYRAAAASEAAADRAVQLYRETSTLMRETMLKGEATLGDLIATEDALASAERAQADARLARARAFATLNLRLGAGASGGASGGAAADGITNTAVADSETKTP
jgi:multidrug efflux system outer membrane protein